MRNLKLSFALVIAVLAVGITVATKASSFGKLAITDCFEILTVTPTATITNDQTLSDALNAAQAASLKASHPYVRAVSSPINEIEECTGDATFCCAEIVVTSNTNAPLVSLEGQAPARYAVADLFFKD